MSIIAFKIEDDRIIVGADGRCMNGDNRIITEDFRKIKLINDDTVFGSVGLAMTTDMFAEYLEKTSYDSSELNNNNDFMRIMYGFQKWLSDEFGWDDETVKEFGGFLMINPHYHGVAYYDDNAKPYVTDFVGNSGAIGATSIYTGALIENGFTIEEAIKASAKKYTSINDNVTIIEIPLCKKN